MNKEQLGEYLWFLLGDRAADNGITINNNIPYENVDSGMKGYMEDIADHILMRQLDERMANMVTTGTARFTLKELIERNESVGNIRDALNVLIQGKEINNGRDE
jgi:hypothetical protein